MSTRVIVTGGAGFIGSLLARRTSSFHLAGVVSGAAEADLGMHGNIDGMRAVPEHARRHPVPPVLVFSSSLAVFGQDPALPAGADGAIGVVGDDTLPRPQTSYDIP